MPCTPISCQKLPRSHWRAENGQEYGGREMGYYKIKVHLRIKPSARPSTALHIDSAKSTVLIDQRHHEGGPPKQCSEQHVFPLDNIILSTSQEIVFEQCAKKMVEDVLSGYNGTLMAYGQSGSGKTFTMTGEFKNPAYRGIIPRAIHLIFGEKMSKPEAEITVHVSYLEIYNEVVYDLLNERQSVQTMEDNGVIELRGLSQIACGTEEEALKIYMKGDRNRSVASQPHNKISNRSHSMFTMYVERHAKTKGLPGKTAAKLNMVDLAAFERIKNSDPVRPFQKDCMAINKSLTFLEQAVSELRKDQLHICFRQSRLTLLLRDALGGNSKTQIIICAHPEDEFLDETISALRFAQRLRDLKTSAVVNKKINSIERKYEIEIADLKQELAFHDALNGKTGISHDDLTEQRRIEIRNKIQAFLSNTADVDIVPVENLKQVQETYSLFKEAHIALRAELDKYLAESQGSLVTEDAPPSMNEMDDDDRVGELDGQGFHVGVAPANARPVKVDTLSSCSERDLNENSCKNLQNSSYSWQHDRETKNKAFAEFKHGTVEGLQHDSFVKRKRQELREMNQLRQQLREKIKLAKEEIQASCHSDKERQPRVDGNMDSNMEGRELIESIQSAKITYQKSVNDLIPLNAKIENIQQELKDCQQSLLESFFRWYDTKQEETSM